MTIWAWDFFPLVDGDEVVDEMVAREFGERAPLLLPVGETEGVVALEGDVFMFVDLLVYTETKNENNFFVIFWQERLRFN